MKRKTVDRPAFMLYAANIQSKAEWRRMSFAERGLWITMVMECWINQEIPADPIELSAYIYSRDRIEHLLPSVMWHFETRGDQLYCPSLEAYRDEQDRRIEKQAAGGKKGAAKTNEARKALSGKASEGAGNSSGYSSGNSQVPRRGTVESLGQIRVDQTRKDQSPSKGGSSEEIDPWVSDYERASNGF